jgi:hypothetical protein
MFFDLRRDILQDMDSHSASADPYTARTVKYATNVDCDDCDRVSNSAVDVLCTV